MTWKKPDVSVGSVRSPFGDWQTHVTPTGRNSDVNDTFTLTGYRDDMNASIQPLSALAPYQTNHICSFDHGRGPVE